jgi:hypothetical protein
VLVVVAFLDLVYSIAELVHERSRYKRFWYWVAAVALVVGLFLVWTK